MSSFGVRVFGDGDYFGSPRVDAACLAIARSIMLRLHSPLVVAKESEDSLQFRFVLALAEAICTMRDEAIATHNDNFLSQITRPDHIQAVWGDILRVPYDPDKTLPQNIEFYQGLIKIFLTGTEFLDEIFPGTHAVNIIACVYLFSLITNVRIYETWRDAAVMFGSPLELFEIGALEPSSESYMGGSALLGPASHPMGRSGLVQAGAQLIVPLDNYSGASTDPVVQARDLVRPVMANLVIIYELTNLFPGGVEPGVTQIAFGRGTQPLSPLPAALAFEVGRVTAFQTYTDDQWLPVPVPTTRKRYFAVLDRELVFGDVPITEAALMDASGTILMYRTFSPINKTDVLDVLLGWNVDFT